MKPEPAPPPIAPRRSGRVLAVLFFLLGALSYGVVRSVDEERFLRSAEKALGEATGLSYALDSARIHLGKELGLGIEGIRIVEPSTGEALVEAEGVLLGLKLEPLRRGQLEFGVLELRSPRFHLAREADGDLNLTPLLDRLALRDDPIEVDVPVPLGRRIPSTLKLDTFRLDAAELTWRDEMQEDSPRRTILGPASIFAFRNGRPFGVTFTLETLASPDTVHARIAIEGELAGSEDLAWFGDLDLDAHAEIEGLHLGDLYRLVQRFVDLELEMDGLLDASFRYQGKIMGDFEGQLDLKGRDARWFVPAIWRRPHQSDVVEISAAVQRAGDALALEDLSIATDDTLLEGRLAFDELSSEDPWIETRVASPAMSVARMRHMVPAGLIDSHVLDHIIDAAEAGWVRVEEFRGAGHISDWENSDLPEHYDVMFGDFVLSDLTGVPFEGMARMTDLGGRLLLVDGDLRLEGFSGNYGESELGRIDGAVIEILGDDTRMDLQLRKGEIRLTELRDFLAHEVLGESTSTFLSTLEVSAGMAHDVDFRFRTDFEDDLRYEGHTVVQGLELTLLEYDLTFEGAAGTVHVDEKRIESEALTAHLGQSRFTLGGSVVDYGDDAHVELVVDTPSFTGRDLYRLMGNREGPADAGTFAGRFWLTGPFEPPPLLGIEADVTTQDFDLAPPLEAGSIQNATGRVTLTADDVLFDLDDVTWHDHHLAARGTVRGIWAPFTDIEVDLKALEEIEIERLVGAPSAPADPQSPPEAGPPPVDATEPEGAEGTEEAERFRVAGRFEVDRARFRDTQLSTFTGRFSHEGELLSLEQLEGFALGGPFAGSMEIRSPTDGEATMSVEIGVDAMDANGLLEMLAISKPNMDGRASGSAQLSMTWPPARRLDQLDGRITLDIREGRIHEGIFLWKVLDLLDLPRLLSDPIDVWKTGLGFDRVSGELMIDGGDISTTALEIDGDSVDLVMAGHLDLPTQEIDGVVTVAPLGLVDRILDPLPAVGPLEPNSLTDYAFRVTGTVDDAKVRLEAFERVQSFLNDLVRRARPRPEEQP